VDIFTMPHKAVDQYEEKPVEQPVRHIEDDPAVALAVGIVPKDIQLGTLWDVPVAFKESVSPLLDRDIYALTHEEIEKNFVDAGFAGFLANWSEEYISDVRANLTTRQLRTECGIFKDLVHLVA
jgi:hypothetical protein